MKTTDFPNHLKEVGKLFVNSTYQYDPGALFADLIDYITCCTLFDGDPPVRERLMKQYKEDYSQFPKAYAEILKALHAQLEVNKWYDILGELYEICSASSKKSALGQFFTPHALCDMTAQIIIGDAKPGQRGQDPASGSARMILAGNAHCMGIEWHAGDLDPVCAKMSAINMAWHGIKGYAHCVDTLAMETKFGYIINPYQNMMNGMPHIVKTNQRAFVTPKDEAEPVEPSLAPEPTQDTITQVNTQLTLF